MNILFSELSYSVYNSFLIFNNAIHFFYLCTECVLTELYDRLIFIILVLLLCYVSRLTDQVKNKHMINSANMQCQVFLKLDVIIALLKLILILLSGFLIISIR